MNSKFIKIPVDVGFVKHQLYMDRLYDIDIMLKANKMDFVINIEPYSVKISDYVEYHYFSTLLRTYEMTGVPLADRLWNALADFLKNPEILLYINQFSYRSSHYRRDVGKDIIGAFKTFNRVYPNLISMDEWILFHLGVEDVPDDKLFMAL